MNRAYHRAYYRKHKAQILKSHRAYWRRRWKKDAAFREYNRARCLAYYHANKGAA